MSTPTSPPPDSAAFEQAKTAFFDGLAHLQAGRVAEAERAFETSLQHVPGRVSTLINLAATRVALGRPAEAIACADQVLAVEPGNADALLHRRNGLGKLVQQADLLRDSGSLEEARTLYRQALDLGADPELMAYCLAGLGEAAAPPRSPASYVQALFDDYAEDFDHHLVGVLHYRVPEGLAAPLAQLHPQAFRSALDLGCGTGLCGPLVRPLVQRLVGLDLAPRILEQARARGVYDELHHGEIVQHLATTAEPHDLVLAADVFIYLGDLAPVFAALSRLMPAGGVFAFSAETEGANELTGFTLQPSLRYAHHEGYLRRLAASHGFEVARMARETVREEQRQPIEGLIVHLRRSG
ncbi:class I SAM-dependent methyltransferase [Piscinibacter sp. HJYY11]|uniref:class I SAM-dependent DNA methyltransferase n=1 Tax=Piscinibacter sp. HJYY11 TaxID=2801333 RepID=UPI00191F351D|nr:tetratricopeptide repeat protein [Piscinibacter sp. HJYY11]MBL0726335.1 tetratricopeptide repeat protein [Piscinibacter sp. HJYY11]